MALLLNILLALILATVVATIVVLVLDRQLLMRAGFRSYLLLIFLGVWAGSLWLPAPSGSEWLGSAAAGLLLLLLGLVVHPHWRRRHLRLLTSEGDDLPVAAAAGPPQEMVAHVRPLREPAALREYYRGMLFWLLILALIGAIIGGYVASR